MSSNIIDRVRLIMEYDTSLTNSENKLKLINEVSGKQLQQIFGNAIKGGFRGSLDDITRLMPPNQLVNGKLFTKSTGSVVGVEIKTIDELFNALDNGLVSPKQIGGIRLSLLKQPQALSPGLRTALIDDLLSKKGVLSKGGSTAKEIKASYMKLGYSDDVADEIAKKVIAKRKKLGIGGTNTKPKPKPKGNPSPGVIAKAKEFYKTANWEAYKKWGVRLGIPLGLLALAWYMASGEDVSDPEVDNDNQGGGGSTTGYRDCNSLDFLSQGCKSKRIRELQTCIGFKGKDVDGIWGPKTQERMKQLGLHTGILVADIAAICKTYNEVQNPQQSQTQTQNQNQNSQSINYFTGEEPYASYDGETLPSNASSEITGSEGPTVIY
jgi:hypothetical protein